MGEVVEPAGTLQDQGRGSTRRSTRLLREGWWMGVVGRTRRRCGWSGAARRRVLSSKTPASDTGRVDGVPRPRRRRTSP